MNINKINSSSGVNRVSNETKGEKLSSLGSLVVFVGSLFRKKKEGNQHSKEEQIMAGVIASDEILGEVEQAKDRKRFL